MTNQTANTHTEFSGEYTRPPKRVKKIALEEHFCIPSMLYLAKDMEKSIAAGPMEYYKKRLLDFDSLRIEEMDKYGIDLSVLSMTVPGVQLEPDVKKAVDLAKEANDTLAAAVQRHRAARPVLPTCPAVAESCCRRVGTGYKATRIQGSAGKRLNQRRIL